MGSVSILETIVEARAEDLDSAQTNLTLNLPVKVQDKWVIFIMEICLLTPSTVEVCAHSYDTPSKTVPIGFPEDLLQSIIGFLEP